MSSIDDIKNRIDIVELVGESVKLRRAGKNYSGFCPFHPNTRTPAFVVFPDSGTWRCFGECNEGGDIFKFVMKKEGWDFTQTLKALAQRAGVVLEVRTPEKEAEDQQGDRLRALLEDAVTLYRHQLVNTPAGKEALAYLQKRGLTPATIEAFGLGYAPNSWDTATHYLTGKGYTEAELLQAGMASERQGGGVYDRFRHRIQFPIRDPLGRMAGFGARILNPEDMPKFLNSPQTILFDKGRLLYGLDLARKAIRTQNQAVIVEGYLDVIVLHQAGFTNTVSPMGTALTEDQLRMLKRFARRIVLALDADAAGAKATLRGLELARQTLDHTDELAFDARGLLRHEARLQADVRVTTLPEGSDPDEVVLKDPAAWARIIEEARPVVEHVMEALSAGRNLEDAKTKSEIASQVLPLIEDVPDAVEREAYRQKLSRLLRVDERALMGAKVSAVKPTRKTHSTPETRPGRPTTVTLGQNQRLRELEAHVLRLLLRQPETLYVVDRCLLKAELSRLGPQDFDHTDFQVLARLVMDSLDQDEMEPHPFLLERVPESVQDMLNELMAPMPMGEPNSTRLVEDLVGSVYRLRLLRLTESLRQMRYLQEDMQSQGELSLDSYQEMVLQYSQAIARLDRALVQPILAD